MRRIALGILGLVLLAWIAFRFLGGTAGVVERALPAFPDYPEPRASFADWEPGATQETVYFESSTPFDFDVILDGARFATPTTGVGTLFLPKNASAERPSPAMVVLHGSGGISPGREMSYGRLLADAGIAAIVLDYYAPRGITDDTNYMLRVVSVTEFDAIADAYGAYQLLSTHPAIDAERIGVMGLSYGGMATRFAMDERVREVYAPDRKGFAAFVDYYGPCFQNLGTTSVNGAPLLTLRGTEDRSNDLEACAARERELEALGVAVERHVYEGAGHAWEISTERKVFEDSPYVTGCEVVYDETGRSSVNGLPILDVAPETTRAERIALRMASGGSMGDCVKYGYLIGRDDETRAKSDAALLRFLRRAF